ncbi:MAG: TIGR00296 family protein [Candidatus Diapherotrites archaeon]|nr:TIGR00296 family protein [Candidatus Diapherotrites archaeon]
MAKIPQAEGKQLLALARKAITTYLEKRERISPPKEPSEKRGVFCTLRTRHDVLRGCIGLPYPTKPLAEAIVEAAISSAAGDPRFKPVTAEELGEIRIELTVLTTPEELECPKAEMPGKIEIGRHGLIVKGQYTSGLLLPQVAVENGPWSPVEFLEATCWKAGLPPQAWKEEGVKISLFEGQIFTEG